MQKCCFPFPMEKYIFRGKLDSSIETYVAFEMKMNTVLIFPPQTNIVEIFFFSGRGKAFLFGLLFNVMGKIK